MSEEISISKNLSCMGGALEINVGSEDYNVLIDFHNLNNSDEEFYNATEIVKQYNSNNPKLDKRIVDWTRSKRFKEIINIWECDFNTPKNKIYFKKRVGSIYNTWIHKDLFLSLMIWLDVKYELAITDLIKQVSKHHFELQQIREEGKSVHARFSQMLSVIDYEANIQRASLNKPPLPIHQNYFSHATKAVNKALFGEQLKRDTLSDEQLQQLEALEKSVTNKFNEQFQGYVIGAVDYHDIYKTIKILIEDEAINIKEMTA